MQESELRSLLTFTNYALGTLIIIFSISFFLKNKALTPLFISIAILIVGPCENLLMKKAAPEDRWVIDQLTSIGMLAFLLLATLHSGKKVAG